MAQKQILTYEMFGTDQQEMEYISPGISDASLPVLSNFQLLYELFIIFADLLT